LTKKTGVALEGPLVEAAGGGEQLIVVRPEAALLGRRHRRLGGERPVFRIEQAVPEHQP
jgi:hypothetical protein